MLKLVIADDEKLIRESISHLIDWSALNIEILAVCKNGLEAFKVISEGEPDLVLTDTKSMIFSPRACFAFFQARGTSDRILVFNGL